MLKAGEIGIWIDGAQLKRVVVIDGPKPAADFAIPLNPVRFDAYALVAVLDSGDTAIVHGDDIAPLRSSSLLA